MEVNGRAVRLIPLLVLALAVTVNAQPGAGARQGRVSPRSAIEIQKVFDGYLLAQMQEVLRLSDGQFAQLVPRVRTLQDARRRHQAERVRLFTELQRMTRATGPQDDAAIKERLVELQENDRQLADDLSHAYAAIDEVLNVRQQGRFRLLEEQIERKKLELLMRARQGPKRQPPGR